MPAPDDRQPSDERGLGSRAQRGANMARLGASTSTGYLTSRVRRLREGDAADARFHAETAEKVLETLGTPSTVSTVGNKSWYYISQRSRRTFQFLGETVVDQKVTAVYFDKNLKVDRVALYGLREGRVFDFLSRTTPSGGEDLSFVGQLFKGNTSFNPL